MTEEIEDEEVEELDGYYPEPMGLHDDSCVIFDTVEFESVFNCYAVQYKAGVLWVLDKDSRKWVDVEAPDAKKGASNVRRIQ